MAKDDAKASKGPLTITSIRDDPLTALAAKHWALAASDKPTFDPALVQRIYNEDLQQGRCSQTRIVTLELSSYLELYLWPHFDAQTATFEHVMSIILMINEKFRENVPAWPALRQHAKIFPGFFQRALDLVGSDSAGITSIGQRREYVLFFINCFQSLEESMVRDCALQLVSMELWAALSPGRRFLEFKAVPELERHWKYIRGKKSLRESVERLADAKSDAARTVYDSVTSWISAHTLASKDLKYVLGEIKAMHKRIDDAAAAEDGGEKKKAKLSSAAKDKSAASGVKPDFTPQAATFIPSLLKEFFDGLDKFAPASDDASPGAQREAQEHLLYLERFVELIIDLLSQLPTRRFVRPVIEDQYFVARCVSSATVRGEEGALLRKLVDMVQFFLHFEIADQSGLALSESDVVDRHYKRLYHLQRMAHKYFRTKLTKFYLANIGSVSSRDQLVKHFSVLSLPELRQLFARLKMPVPSLPGASDADLRSFMVDAIGAEYELRKSQVHKINEFALFPSEQLLWDNDLIPLGAYNGSSVLAMPKLNLQFLTVYDYLVRSFKLFRLESAYEIRMDLVNAIRHMKPRLVEDGTTAMTGWARMALPVRGFTLTEVSKPKLGETKPAAVKAEIEIDLFRCSGAIRQEWEQIREHDVLFLVSIESPIAANNAGNTDEQRSKDKERKTRGDYEAEEKEFMTRFGIKAVRGCEVWEVRDADNKLINELGGKPDSRPGGRAGSKRTLKVFLDSAQYQMDMAEAAKDSSKAELYSSFNLLVRRKPKENNFKAVLETIRDLMNVDAVGAAMPGWLRDVFLGYGDAAAANYRALQPPGAVTELDMVDSFVDGAHALSSFPSAVNVTLADRDGNSVDKSAASVVKGPFRARFVPAPNGAEEVHVSAYAPPTPGPYPQDQPKLNKVPFTPVQMEAIRSGLSPGLTMVVGPPGTGKTDVAVQIISNIYHNYPGQRTLLVTHSNQALNDLFEKIMDRDIESRHLLRLGAGADDLHTDDDYSKWGRVNMTLSRRLELLEEVDRLARSLDLGEDAANTAGYTCESAQYFKLYHIVARVEKFKQAMATSKHAADDVVKHFPFTKFFATAPNQPILRGESFEADLKAAEGCFRHIEHVFDELKDYQPFELLRSSRQRSDYLLSKQARIIAMTCTHAALIRSRLVELGFKFDNIVMEEAAQILEIETLIPILLQTQDNTAQSAEERKSRLKRVVLIGDHHQLPPVVKNMAFQKYGHLDQSLFARFVRLGVPTVNLDFQGRARPSIAALYSWRYPGLKNLPATTAGAYLKANTGFALDYQLVDVQDHNGQGESTPTAHFYQNLGEAEYICAVYQYMRLLGYPARKITVLTTYNGQKALLQQVFNQRCNPQTTTFGLPSAISTVDKYQGSQNDFVLLSLVRTKTVGHIRDIRRLVVALSRARLGLYIFCRKALYENCFELARTFSQLNQRPSRLQLVPGEVFPTDRSLSNGVEKPYQVESLVHMAKIVQHMQQQQQQTQTQPAVEETDEISV